MLGKASMDDLRNRVKKLCEQTFDSHLDGRPFDLRQIPHYKTHKALVYTETFDHRFSKFAAANSQRLTDHFRVILQNCENLYKSKQHLLLQVTPAADSHLDSEHVKIARDVKQMLDDQSADVVDSDQYREADKVLASKLQEGQVHVRNLNAEKWKNHFN